jgi:hypothetical protein
VAWVQLVNHLGELHIAFSGDLTPRRRQRSAEQDAAVEDFPGPKEPLIGLISSAFRDPDSARGRIARRGHARFTQRIVIRSGPRGIAAVAVFSGAPSISASSSRSD